MSEVSAGNNAVAGWWRRFLSLWYEVLLLTALVLLLQAILQALFQWATGLPVTALSDLDWARWLNFGCIGGGVFGYFAFCWRRGQTLAMKTWRMRLTGQNGEHPCWRSVIARFVAASLFYGPLLPLWIMAWYQREWIALAWMSTGWCFAPFVWTLFDRDRQLLHDRLAGTRLVLAMRKKPQATQ